MTRKWAHSLIVQARFSGRPCLPAAVYPKPLVRVFTNGLFDGTLYAPRVFRFVAGDLDLGMETQDVAALLCVPKRKSGDYGSSAPRREFRESRICARRHTEK